MQIERFENESKTAYHKRLIYGKIGDKTLADTDYSELAEKVYGQKYSSDSARKMMYGSFKTLEMLDAEGVEGFSGSDMKDEIDTKLLELQKERQRFFDQRREYNKLATSDARMEHMFDRLAEAAASLNETVGQMYDKDAAVLMGTGDSEAILVFCDWHYGMVTNNIWNTYNTDICRERVRSVTEKAIKRLHLHNVSRLHVVVLGDLIHGAIHTSARVASEELVCDQIMQVSEILAQTIEELDKHVNETLVYMTYGNHARTVQNKKDNLHRDNMERLIPWWLERRLCDHPTIRVMDTLDDSEFIYIDACGVGICGSHGDLDTVRSSPKVLSTLFQRKYGREINHILLADKHHREEYEEFGITATICGALCGTEDYANERRLYSTPEQLMLVLNRECGVDASYRLPC